MKTLFKSKLAVTAALTILLSLLGVKARAQVYSPYYITNNTGCMITITWDYYTLDASASCVYCGSGGPVTLAPGEEVTLIDDDFGSCGPACDISINITDIDGIPLLVPVSANSGSPSPTLPPVSPCVGPGSSMSWSLFNCSINP